MPKPKFPNGLDQAVPEALRYLATHDRPSGGEQRFNAIHLYQLADEIEGFLKGLEKPQAQGPSPEVVALGSRLIEFHSQNKTVAASMIAEKKVSGQRSYRVATRRQSFRRPNMISMRLRRL